MQNVVTNIKILNQLVSAIVSLTGHLKIQTFSRSSSLSRMLAFLFASAACWSLALTMVSMHWWHFFSSSCRVAMWIHQLKTSQNHGNSGIWYIPKQSLHFDLLYLICNSCNVSHALNVRWELVYFLHQVLHHFYMALKKGHISVFIIIHYFSTKQQQSTSDIQSQAKTSINPMNGMAHCSPCGTLPWGGLSCGCRLHPHRLQPGPTAAPHQSGHR